MKKDARFRRVLLGLAPGDALGTTLEFRSPGSFREIGDMVGGGPFNLEAGQWTDDTSMTLCLAESHWRRRNGSNLLRTSSSLFRHGQTAVSLAPRVLWG